MGVPIRQTCGVLYVEISTYHYKPRYPKRRIYQDLELQRHSKIRKRRIMAKLREDRCAATQPNET
jgi:hypothetical protein